jgi:GGDEF domain-containing protein
MEQRDIRNDSDKELPEIFIHNAARELGLPLDSEAVLKHARLLQGYLEIWDLNVELQIKLNEAERDPLTDYWLKGPGFRKLDELISLVENTQDGLIDAEDSPNAIFGLGIDLEGLHYTNNFYGQEAGDTRLIETSMGVAGVAEIIRETVRQRDRREQPRSGKQHRPEDIRIRTGGDEFLIACGVRLTPEHDEVDVANTIIDRMKIHKAQTIPGARILFKGGFWERGQKAEGFYYSVEPKVDLVRFQKLARPVVKIARLGIGQYKPSQSVISEL